MAEGVETADQLEVLKAFQCKEYQGYFFERPIRYDDFTGLLESEEKRVA